MNPVHLFVGLGVNPSMERLGVRMGLPKDVNEPIRDRR
jgi:hypothetical protein